MKRIVAMLLVIFSLFTCCMLCGCEKKDDESIVYEENFLGKWSSEEGLFNFQYIDGVYCGGGVGRGLSTVLFTKYTATKDVLTIYTDDGKVERFNYKFDNDCLYIGDSKLERFD